MKKKSVKLSIDKMLKSRRVKRKAKKSRNRQRKLLRKLRCVKLINLRDNIVEDIRNKRELLKQLDEESRQRPCELLNKDERLTEDQNNTNTHKNNMLALDTMFSDMNIQEELF